MSHSSSLLFEVSAYIIHVRFLCDMVMIESCLYACFGPFLFYHDRKVFNFFFSFLLWNKLIWDIFFNTIRVIEKILKRRDEVVWSNCLYRCTYTVKPLRATQYQIFQIKRKDFYWMQSLHCNNKLDIAR
jgi:hypothetical protein